MEYRRILTMQDISCVGQCSMTVALPVLSACGVETCVLPTAVLSTHTGGFWKPAVTHLDGALEPIWKHWKESGILFDGIYTGYLGSVEAIAAAQQVIRELLAPGGVVIVDPAMADHGKLYSGFDKKYVAYMGQLCAQADVILPNLTEGAMLSGIAYQERYEQDYVQQILKRLPGKTVVLTGVSYAEDQTGVVLYQNGEQQYYVHQKAGGNCSGTGDLFAASFTGAVMRGKSLFDAVRISADFTRRCIEETHRAPAHWYGVKFEPVLPELMKMLEIV